MKSHYISTPKLYIHNIVFQFSASNVTRDLIEGFCERGASMVVFDFNGLTYEQCRKMVYEIRQGVFNYSLKTDRVPYSMATVLDLSGQRITTGNIFNTKVQKNTFNICIVFNITVNICFDYFVAR